MIDNLSNEKIQFLEWNKSGTFEERHEILRKDIRDYALYLRRIEKKAI